MGRHARGFLPRSVPPPPPPGRPGLGINGCREPPHPSLTSCSCPFAHHKACSQAASSLTNHTAAAFCTIVSLYYSVLYASGIAACQESQHATRRHTARALPPPRHDSRCSSASASSVLAWWPSLPAAGHIVEGHFPCLCTANRKGRSPSAHADGCWHQGVFTVSWEREGARGTAAAARGHTIAEPTRWPRFWDGSLHSDQYHDVQHSHL